MKQTVPVIDFFKAIAILDAIVLKTMKSYGYLQWQETPLWIIDELRKNVDQQGMVPYNQAINVLQRARTSKMGGLCNKGLGEIHEEWKKIKQVTGCSATI